LCQHHSKFLSSHPESEFTALEPALELTALELTALELTALELPALVVPFPVMVAADEILEDVEDEDAPEGGGSHEGAKAPAGHSITFCDIKEK
jgi:hypothetical protein